MYVNIFAMYLRYIIIVITNINMSIFRDYIKYWEVTVMYKFYFIFKTKYIFTYF